MVNCQGDAFNIKVQRHKISCTLPPCDADTCLEPVPQIDMMNFVQYDALQLDHDIVHCSTVDDCSLLCTDKECDYILHFMTIFDNLIHDVVPCTSVDDCSHLCTDMEYDYIVHLMTIFARLSISPSRFNHAPRRILPFLDQPWTTYEGCNIVLEFYRTHAPTRATSGGMLGGLTLEIELLAHHLAWRLEPTAIDDMCEHLCTSRQTKATESYLLMLLMIRRQLINTC